ncbi:MAG: hypothetical protein K0V04_44975 [Deltaproteobacteria bacterium]|nr:hypothetical protein [Deltaproteobacteria bacterium]
MASGPQSDASLSCATMKAGNHARHTGLVDVSRSEDLRQFILVGAYRRPMTIEFVADPIDP